MTDGSIQAGLTGTFINIKLTVRAIKPGRTLTGIHANQIMASRSVVTGAGLTLIYFMFTVDPLVKRDSISENIGNVANCPIRHIYLRECLRLCVCVCVWEVIVLLFWCEALCGTVSTHEKCLKLNK